MTITIDPFYRGDTVEWLLVFTNETSQPLDITGWLIYLTLKAARDDSDANAAMQLRFSPPAGGETLQGMFHMQLSADLTEVLTANRYFADIQVKKPDGVITTFGLGSIRVLKDVTRNR